MAVSKFYFSQKRCFMKKCSDYFVVSAAMILILAGLAKIVSSFGFADILLTSEPFSGLQFRYFLLVAGLIELGVSGLCIFSRNCWMQNGLIASLATTFLVYRAGLFWIGYTKPCGCMGNLTANLHLSQEKADLFLDLIVAYLLIGSYCMLAGLIYKNCKLKREIIV
jgi:hypothetical protein